MQNPSVEMYILDAQIQMVFFSILVEKNKKNND